MLWIIEIYNFFYTKIIVKHKSLWPEDINLKEALDETSCYRGPD